MTNSNYQEFDEKLMMMYTQTRFYDEDESSVEGELLQVTQNLEPAQYNYEFPTKSCLKALAYLDREDDCYFDESSFISSTTIAALSSVDSLDQDTVIDQSNLCHETDDDDQLIDDGSIPSFKLPAQVTDRKIPRKSIPTHSGHTVRPVGPSSFLADAHKYKVTQDSAYKDFIQEEEQDNLSFYCNESVPIMDSDFDSSTESSLRSMESRTVLIKISKCKSIPITIVQSTPAYSSSDEGYDDTMYNGELESNVKFYPVYEDEQEDCIFYCDSEQDKRNAAATQIQALWRGYQSRKKQQFASLRPEQRVVVNLAQLCGRNYRHKMNQVEERLYQLEQRLREETAMRVSFEKAMEDMTIVMDQQQKILCDRLEQEVHMREVYEAKMNSALAQLQPLESRLRKEVSARSKMEEMMTRVLDQMHETETSRQQQVKEDAESKKQMQYKLDLALDEISLLKKPTSRASSRLQKNDSISNVIKKENSTSRSSVRKSIVPTTTNKIDVARRPVSRQQQIFERPSVIPSNRRPVLGTNQRTSAKTTKTTTTTTTTTTRRPLLSRK